VGKFSILLWAGVMATLAIVIVAGLPHLKLDALAFWRAPPARRRGGYAGLGAALIYSVYRLPRLLQHLLHRRRVPRAGQDHSPRIVISILVSARSIW